MNKIKYRMLINKLREIFVINVVPIQENVK